MVDNVGLPQLERPAAFDRWMDDWHLRRLVDALRLAAPNVIDLMLIDSFQSYAFLANIATEWSALHTLRCHVFYNPWYTMRGDVDVVGKDSQRRVHYIESHCGSIATVDALLRNPETEVGHQHWLPATPNHHPAAKLQLSLNHLRGI